MPSNGKEMILRGLPISKGIGIGLPIFFTNLDDQVPEIQISQEEIEQEIERYRLALEKSCEDVRMLQKVSMNGGAPEIISILETHLEIMQDPLLTSVMEARIRSLKRNIESIFYHVIEEYKARFSALKDHYFQERVRDIVDVSRRILDHLRPLKRLKIAEVPHNSIILSQELVPSEIIEAKTSLVSAFVTAAGGITSHVAIIARAKGIPYVTNIDFKQLKNVEVYSTIVDGSGGIVVLNPSKATLKYYQGIQKDYQKNYKVMKSLSHLKGETIDGYEVKIFANLETPEEIDRLIRAGALGIGLFRSEYLFLSQKQFPEEQEQFEIYQKMVCALKGRPLVVRVFDIGGDKSIEMPPESAHAKYFNDIGPELNPALGCRAIRFLLRYPEILENQLRAILRASAFGQIQILVPMVSDIAEMHAVRKMIEKIKHKLQKAGVKVANRIPLGCMIEVPSSVIMCDAIAKEVDFLSIGTNDLVQYILAADRNNFHTADLYFSTHPSLLRLIRMIVSFANQARKPVILCGEHAADPLIVPLLIGLGIREFSVAVRHIPIVKHTVRKWRILEACHLAETALEFSSAKELGDYLSKEADR